MAEITDGLTSSAAGNQSRLRWAGNQRKKQKRYEG